VRVRSALVVLLFLLLVAPASADTSAATIRRWMTRTIEVGSHPEVHFKQLGHRASAPDGSGGTLTAVIGVRHITADGKGQLVFFFHDNRFLGWDANVEISAIRGVKAAGTGRFDVTYVRYASSDPLCCPSLSPRTVGYRWNGSRMQALGTRPRDPGGQLHVRLKS
jgi:hypothetical protein